MGPQIVPDIRLISASDSIAELTDLLHQAYRALAEQGMRFVASHQDEQVTARRIAKGECYLAFHEGELVSTVTLDDAAHTKGSPWYERPDVASFHQFAVRPHWQDRGIGSRMLDYIECRAAQKGVAELALDTAEPARHLINFYAARGYRFIEYVRWDAVNYRSVVLSKRLAQPAGAQGNNANAGIVSAG
jgi:GNAT superfamily N-acetyltransferase